MRDPQLRWFVRYRETPGGRWKYLGPYLERDDARLAKVAVRSWGFDRSVVCLPADRPVHVRPRGRF